MVKLSNNNSQVVDQLGSRLSCSRTILTGLTLVQCQDCGQVLSCSHISSIPTNNFSCSNN